MAAERAAHFTTTFENKPSIFEVVAQESLNSLVHPALQKVATFLAAVNPKMFSWISQYYDEVFFVLNGLLQHHYLKTKGASFSENFYGLQRTAVDSNSTELSEYHKKLSIVVLVVLPYVKRKLEEKIEIYKLENAEGLLQRNLWGFYKHVLLISHSLLSVSMTVWNLTQYLRYMCDQSEFQSPQLQILRLKLIYGTELQDVAGFWTGLFHGQLNMSEISSGLFKNSVQSILELTAFVVQFLQVWNEERPNYSFNLLPYVPPPPKETNAGDYTEKCPLCLQHWKIPTVLPVSGYVFCFPCILRHLRENPCCPVTNLPAKPLDIVRLYDSCE